MLYSKNKKRGFTLVELIVVLVILAILAALLIPALTGYIDKAKKDQVIAETRMLHEAIQTEMVELYGSNTNWKTSPILAPAMAVMHIIKPLQAKTEPRFPEQSVFFPMQKAVMSKLPSCPRFPACKPAEKVAFSSALPVMPKFTH